MSARWYLKRDRGQTFLVVEERGPLQRGFMVAVNDRAAARRHLGWMRTLVSEIGLPRPELPTYDPVAADG